MIITVTLVYLVKGARVPCLLLLLGLVPIVVDDDDEAHLFLHFGTIIS